MAAAADLDALGIKYGTDKASPSHNYLFFYSHFMQKYCDAPITLLEYGCYTGASLNMWAEFFPKAQIIGVDIDLTEVKTCWDNIKTIEADCSDHTEMKAILDACRPTIIIDDASHKWSHQIATFETSFPHLLAGGIYICEDIQTSFGEYRKYAMYADHPLDGAQYFAKMALLKAAEGASTTHPLLENTPPVPTIISKYIDYIIFRKHCVLIQKVEDVATHGSGQ